MVVDFVRPLIFFSCLIFMYFWVSYLKVKPKENVTYFVGPFCLLLHVMIFTAVSILNSYKVITIEALTLNLWSLVIRLQAVYTIGFYGITLWYRQRYENKP